MTKEEVAILKHLSIVQASVMVLMHRLSGDDDEFALAVQEVQKMSDKIFEDMRKDMDTMF